LYLSFAKFAVSYPKDNEGLLPCANIEIGLLKTRIVKENKNKKNFIAN
jgi:hypothetical protein